ncbi:MAG: NAD(P)H-quinone oxidoreductase [Pseudomonadales bacterium]|nr:NAD(P)H-quinone oxidoreductase [Pseudomonadales bacterium]
MKYVALREYGVPEVMEIQEMDKPEPRDGEVLIKVAAAGVNRPDVIQRQGHYPPPPDASPVLGLEVSGEIVAIGASANEPVPFALGDAVCALVNGGGYAEYVRAPITQCLPVPKGLSLIEAAALPETCFTVWSNVFMRFRLQAGESLLIHGGASGVGTTAIQMAKLRGARVAVTVGSEEKRKACEQLGADLAINYRDSDFVEALEAFGEGQGMDVILDMVGGDYISKNIKIAALDGRICNIAFLQGPVAKVNFLPVMLKRLTLTGSTLRPQSPQAKAEIAADLLEHIWPAIEAGKMKPVMANTYAFSDVIKAHKLMESNQHIGKIVLDLCAQNRGGGL